MFTLNLPFGFIIRLNIKNFKLQALCLRDRLAMREICAGKE